MANAADLKKKLADIKARPLLLIVGGVLLVGIIAIFFGLRGGGSNSAEGNLTSQATPVPNIRSTPGMGETQDTTYNQLQIEQNRLRAKQAEQQGGSAVPTLINQSSSIASLNPVDEQQLQYQHLLEEQNRRANERVPTSAGPDQQQQQMQQAFEGLMQKQANDLMHRWQPVNQVVVGGQIILSPEEEKAKMASVTGTNSNGNNMKRPALYKAGDIVFGVLETGINSDEPGPIMARIVSGPLKGAKLIGTMQRQNDKAMLTFNLINAPSLPDSVAVNIVAIDPETARTALASDVNHHYLLKYGAVFAGAFLQGVSQAVQSSLQPSFTSSNNTFVATSTQATTRQEVLVGLGQVGQQISQEIQKYDPQPTVTVDSGTSMGLLFLSDFTLASGTEVTNPENKPVALTQTLSAVPGGTGAGTIPPPSSGGHVAGQGTALTTTTTTSTGPLPGTVGPRNQTQETTVTTAVQQPVTTGR